MPPISLKDAVAAAARELARFCSIAMGSASEVEYHLLLARDLSLIKPAEYKSLADAAAEVKRMLTGLWQKLKRDGC